MQGEEHAVLTINKVHSNRGTIMKKTVLSLLAGITFAYAVAAQGETQPSPETVAPSAATAAKCVIPDPFPEPSWDVSMKDDKHDVKTDFFMLVYSHSPSFCKEKEEDNKLDEVKFQCDPKNEFGWVIHGLWGQSEEAFIKREKEGHPRFCKGDLDPLEFNVIKPYLCMSPGARLLQGEWEKHGACDFKTADEYFAKALELYNLFAVPPADREAKPAMNWMKDNNPELKDKWLYLSGSEFGICFDKDFKVMSCPKQK
jgi:ribonuclease T2